MPAADVIVVGGGLAGLAATAELAEASRAAAKAVG
jgi:monoamine oxidase